MQILKTKTTKNIVVLLVAGTELAHSVQTLKTKTTKNRGLVSSREQELADTARAELKQRPRKIVVLLVAGAGLEPATFGL